MIHTDGVPTIAMRESEPLIALVDRDPGDETSYDPEAEAEESKE